MRVVDGLTLKSEQIRTSFFNPKGQSWSSAPLLADVIAPTVRWGQDHHWRPIRSYLVACLKVKSYYINSRHPEVQGIATHKRETET
jgi:hypothetical protein